MVEEEEEAEETVNEKHITVVSRQQQQQQQQLFGVVNKQKHSIRVIRDSSKLQNSVA